MKTRKEYELKERVLSGIIRYGSIEFSQDELNVLRDKHKLVVDELNKITAHEEKVRRNYRPNVFVILEQHDFNPVVIKGVKEDERAARAEAVKLSFEPNTAGIFVVEYAPVKKEKV